MNQDTTLCFRCRGPAFQPRVTLNSAELFRKLRTEFGPSGVNCNEIERMLVLCARDLEDYKAEMARLRALIFYLDAQKQRLCDHRAKLRSLLSPIRKLPNELLLRIFEFTRDRNRILEYAEDENDEEDPDALPPPSTSLIKDLSALSISAVCSRWRMLALSPSSARLWSRIQISLFPTIEGSVSKASLSTLKHYLEMSSHYPLTLKINTSHDLNRTAELDRTVFDLLIQNMYRWKSFSYTGDYRLSAQKAFSENDLHFPVLEHLDVPDSEDVSLFRDAPMLRSLHTSSSTLNPALPLGQITSLKCTLPQEPTKVLALCPNVSRLYLLQLRNQGAYSNSLPTPQVKSHKVNYLDLTLFNHSIDSKFLEAVFESYTLPAVTELHLFMFPSIVFSWPRQSFHGFISRSSCSITSLSISSLGISDSDLIYIFHLMPSIMNLELFDSWITTEVPGFITNRLISHLQESGSDASALPVLPRLRHLLLDVGGETFDDAGTVKMVLSRWSPYPEHAATVGVDNLRSFELRFLRRKVNNTIYSPLRALERMGLQVKVTGAKGFDV
ncbi:hypothetical protein GYMLUDRAFT_49770 [Collybiopsis luxurians FD-317 M1]|uniref:F-box domain-containing protein n=1 Tax=Collybiopsis luxurians FD-317 M1 TaxID=944289 RepID=A0A0D0BDS0_9AGAR|nr:hypothetical protein GYMLUDRAFT_49770 [Collybiopsis luxurians FD-317 M1]